MNNCFLSTIKTTSIVCLLLLNSCVKDTNEPVDIDANILSLAVNGNDVQDSVIDIIADGNGKYNITAKLGSLSDDNLDVSFFTSSGELQSYESAASSNNITVKAVNKEAGAQLKASITPESSAYVTAKVKDYLVKRTINFLPAYPDTFFVKPDAYFTTSDKITIDVELLRNSGYVSSKIPVYFSATVIDTTGLQVTVDSYKFIDNSSKASPATVKAVVQKINAKTGSVKVKVSCKNNGSALVEKQVDIKFQ